MLKLVAKLSFLSVAVSSVMILAMNGLAGAQAIYQSGSVGTDVSYPNCTAKIPNAAFGIVGVTHGLFYSYNSCVAAEASHFSNLSLYMNTGWYDQSSHINTNFPKSCTGGDADCLAYNYGYNAALDSLSYASSQGVHSPAWWLDVETANSWSTDTAQNRNSLQGSYDALAANGATTIGAYSTTDQWNTITGSWQNGWPNWGATTWRKASQAAKYCSGHQFTGGSTYLIQYSGKLDQDYAC